MTRRNSTKRRGKTKPDCFKCKYKGDIVGTAHISCKHPAYGNIGEEPLVALLSLLLTAGRLPPIKLNSQEIEVEGDPDGIRNGWFNHPFEFDPVWLKKCTGFKEKEEENDV